LKIKIPLVTELTNHVRRARTNTSARKKKNNNEVPAWRIDVDVALHGVCVLLPPLLPRGVARTLQQEHVDDAGGERILDKTMNRICELCLTSFQVAFK
jgi:hypothetical protein